MTDILEQAQAWHAVRMDARTFPALLPNDPVLPEDSHEGEYSTCWCCCTVCAIYNPHYTDAHRWSETWGDNDA